MQEFCVTYGPSTADSGLNLGSVVTTVTKSGTDVLHGGIYEYIRSNAARCEQSAFSTWLQRTPLQPVRRNPDGPVRKDKAFFICRIWGQRSARSPIYSRFVLSCIDTLDWLGPGTPGIK